MLMASRLIGLAALATSTLAQLQTVDTGTGIVIGLAIPDVQVAPFDVVVSISAPAKVGWAGLAWGGTMLRAPLSVAWPHEDSAVASSRWAEGYTTPQPYDGASIFVLPASKASSTGWTAMFLCEGCSEWAGGSLDPNGEADLAFAFGTQPVEDTADLDTRFGYHAGRGFFGFDLSAAKMDDGEWDALITSLSVDGGDEEVEDEVPDDAEEDPEDAEEVEVGEPEEPAEDTEELPEDPEAPEEEAVDETEEDVEEAEELGEDPEEVPEESIDEPVDEPEEDTEDEMDEAEEDPVDEPEEEPEEELEETEEESEEDTETPIEEPAEDLEEPPEEESEEPTKTAVDPPTTVTQVPTLILAPGEPFPFPDLPIDEEDLWELLPGPILLPAPPIFTLLPTPVPDGPFTGDEAEDEPTSRARVPDSPLFPEPGEPIMEEGEEEDDDEEFDWDECDFQNPTSTTLAPPTTATPSPRGRGGGRGRGGRWGRRQGWPRAR